YGGGIQDEEWAPERMARPFNGRQFGRKLWIHQDGDDRCLGNHLTQELHSLRAEVAASEEHNARYVAARSVEAGDEALCHCVLSCHEDKLDDLPARLGHP